MKSRDAKHDTFFAGLGNFLGTWGLGITLVMFRFWNEDNMFLLSSFLLILSMIAAIFSVFSPNFAKRCDASHILIIALSGLMCSMNANDERDWHLWTVTIALTLLYLRNIRVDFDELTCNESRRAVPLYAPMGCSILFPVLLARPPSDSSLVAFCAVTLFVALQLAKHERKLALSIYPIGAVLLLCFYYPPLNSAWASIISVSAIALVYYLRRQRRPHENALFERRLLMDDVTVVFALSLLLRSAFGMAAAARYLLIALAFLLLAGAYAKVHICPNFPMLRKTPSARAAALDPTNLRMRRNAAIGAASVALWLSMQSWYVPSTDYPTLLLRITDIFAIGVTLFFASQALHTYLLADLSKFISVHAVFLAHAFIQSPMFITFRVGTVIVAAALQYAMVAFVIYSANSDLHARRQGAWQGIFDPRSLIHMRQSRSNVFDFVSKMPLIGWVFHFADKVATSLHATFGKKRTWTISHYAILAVAWLGLASTQYILKNLTGYFSPSVSRQLFGNPEIVAQTNLVISVLSIFLYTSILYLFGAALHVKFLRLLAFIMAAVNLLGLMFSNMGEKGTHISWFFYIAVFFCIMGIFAILYRRQTPGR